MADSISIVMKMNEDISGKLKSIASTSKGVSKEFEVLQNRADALGKRYADFNQMSAKTAAEALDVKRAMDEAAKSFKKTGDEADQVRFQQLREEYTALTDAAKTYAEEAKQTQKAMRETYDQARKLEDGSGSGSGGFLTSTFGKTLGGALAASGVIREIGSSIAGAGSLFVESAVGQPMATAINSALSGAFSGAAAGAIAGLPGMAIGALGGGLAGALSGGTQVYAQQDDAFKSYYQQLYEDSQTKASESLTSGSATAAQRELDAIAFDRLLGDGIGAQYLSDLRTLAAETPMEYSDLTDMSRALATGFGDAPDRMLELMTAIGDAGSAVGVTAADMTEMARAMSRMNSSGKATLEYLNIFQDRGVDVIGMLGKAMGKTQGEIYDMISKGKINGQKAADIIQTGMEAQYSGAMEEMAATFSGLTSTLSDAMTEIDAARGIGYNQERTGGLQAEIDAYGGGLGQALETLNGIAGQNAAYMENLSEQYMREALSAVLMGHETTLYDDETAKELQGMRDAYLEAWNDYDQGNQEAGLKMESLKEQAEAMATAAYESSDQYQIMHETELNQIAAIRENTAALDGWRNAYELQQEQSKGRGAAIGGDEDESEGVRTSEYTTSRTSLMEDLANIPNSNAYGLKYVPYDGYPAMLHQGERVLTAEESRRQSRSGAGGLSVTITGPVSVRQDSDIDAIVMRLADELEARALAYGG